MGFDDGRDQLRHKESHSGFNRYGELLRPEPLELRRFRQWGLDSRDPDSLDVARRLTKVWRSWSAQDRQLLLDTAEAIARAERAKRNWSPKALRGAYRQLIRASINAFKEAHKLAELMPPPWKGDREGVGAMVRLLVKHGTDIIHDTSLGDVPIFGAARLIQQLKRKALRQRRQMRWELLRDLAWLASGKTLSDGFSERTVRRYLEPHRPFFPPGYQVWNQHWTLIGTVSRLARLTV